MDPLFDSINELRKEKSKLCYILEEKRREREKNEKVAEVLRVKHHQLKDKNTKLRETLKVAQFKVVESQVQLDRFQKIAELKRARVKELNEMKEKLEMGIPMEDDSDSEIASQFDQIRNARLRYRDENLQCEITEQEKGIKNLEEKIAEENRTLEDDENKLEALRAETAKHRQKCESIGFPEELQQDLDNVWKEVRINATAKLEIITSERVRLRNKLDSFDNVEMEN